MSEIVLVNLIRKISRIFYDDLTCIIIDYLCKHKKMEDNTFSIDYNLKPNDVRGALHKLERNGFLLKKEIKKSDVREDIKTSITKNTTFCNWTFNTDIMNSIDSKVSSIKEAKFLCKKCNKEYKEMDIYITEYKCPDDNSPLEKQKSTCTDPNKLIKESNKLFKSFEESIRKLEDFKIPREFYGYDPINRPNFNQPDKISVQGFRGHYSDLKTPVVKIQFNTLKTDVYKEENCFKEDKIAEAKKEEPSLFYYYIQKTKDRILKKIAASTKRGVKRKKKEERKLIKLCCSLKEVVQ